MKIRLSVFSSPNPQSFSICYGGEELSPGAAVTWTPCEAGGQWGGERLQVPPAGSCWCDCDWAGWWGEVPEGGSPESSRLEGEERALPSSLHPAVSAPKALYLQIELFHTAFRY